ncbi:obscurin isoform X3 [Paralichthys olivaceus]|uniref:obscurin isoform X3 n=1 Tax=Paralichthys olivaceus TaxID=8255 RepID=UPI003751484B
MDEIKWIKMSLLLLLIPFTAAQDSFIIVRAGAEVILPCEPVREDHVNCGATIWFFRESERAGDVNLVHYGQLDTSVISKSKADRIRLAANCSLVIREVTVEDAGLYLCRKFDQTKQIQRDHVFHLSVVTMTEQKRSDEVTLSCSVSTYEACREVKWLFMNKDVDEDNKDLKTSQSGCSATVSFSKSSFVHTTKDDNLFKCKVNDGHKEEEFAFIPPSSAAQDSFIIVRAGAEVILPCEPVTEDHVNCGATIWIFSESEWTREVNLVLYGQLDTSVISKSKADRIRLAANCSLVIREVTVEDAGFYVCRKSDQTKQIQTDHVFYLSVVTMTEQKRSDEVTLNCSVSTYKACREVKWLFMNKDVDEDNKDLKTSQSDCSATVSFSKSSFVHTTKDDNLFKCKVKDGHKEEEFAFIPPSSGKNKEKTTTPGAAQDSSVIVRAGAEVILPCEPVTEDHVNCRATIWFFRESEETRDVNLVLDGQLDTSVISKSKADRIRLAANCSLVIREVTVEDVGVYACRKSDQTKQIQTDHVFHLSVVTMTEQKRSDEVTLSCSVSTYKACSEVKWLFMNKDVDEDNKDLKTSQSGCSATVSFSKSSFVHTTKDDNLFKCKVKDGHKEEEFAFIPPSSEGKNKEKTTTPGAAQDSFIIVRAGAEVILPCEPVTEDHVNCGATIWSFRKSEWTEAVHLVLYGQLDTSVISKSKADRIRLAANCSLVIREVTVEDARLYLCRKFDQTKLIQTDHVFYLSVVTMTEQKRSDEVTLSCSVSTFDACSEVKWLFMNKDVDEDNKDLKTSQSGCLATVSFSKSSFVHTTNDDNLFKCKVKDGHKEEEFAFIPPSSEGKNKEKTTTPGALTAQYSFIIVRAGAEVILPCEPVTEDHVNCGATIWFFRESERAEAVNLVLDGQLDTSVISKSKADRIRLAANCSLVIREVTVEDVGVYVCRKSDQTKQIQTDHVLYLSVVTMTEQKRSDEVTLSCSVTTFDACSEVKWLFMNKDVDEDNKDLKTSQSGCSATVSFSKSSFVHTTKDDNLFKCKVKDGDKEEELAFIPPSSEGKNKEKTTTPGDWWRYIALAVGLATIVILVVIVVRWRRNKGNKTQTDENTVDPPDDVAYASISHSTNSAAQIRGGDDAVTYSTVKAPSSTTGPSADPSLYATITFRP